MPRRFLKLFSFVLAGALVLAACGDDDESAESTETAETATETTMAPTETTVADPTMDIVETATAAGDFTSLVAAVEAAGLVETLQGDGPYTVFAPTDEAFSAALEDLGLTADELLADTETLASILTYHVVEGEVPAADVVGLDGQAVPTVNGADVEITVDGETVMVNDATVTTTDIFATNGVIHVIDSVLLPPA
ncbi:MAG TPA: fasciclin domain-containing protein [Acidimicrobiales bacterium]